MTFATVADPSASVSTKLTDEDQEDLSLGVHAFMVVLVVMSSCATSLAICMSHFGLYVNASASALSGVQGKMNAVGQELSALSKL